MTVQIISSKVALPVRISRHYHLRILTLSQKNEKSRVSVPYEGFLTS